MTIFARAIAPENIARVSRKHSKTFHRARSAAIADDVPAMDALAKPPKQSHRDQQQTLFDVRKPSTAAIEAFNARTKGELWLAPLTKGGNLPFRRLVAEEFAAKVTVSEMAFARFLLRGNRVERARLRRTNDVSRGGVFGAQIATNAIAEGVYAGLMIAEFGDVDFLDLNCGCPIHETWKRNLGAALLKKPAKLERLVEGLANGIPLPLTVKIRLGIDSIGPARRICESLENAGAAAIIIHGRTKEQRYTKSADWEAIREIVSERKIPIIGNGDILTYYEARDRINASGVAAAMTGRGALIKPWIFKEFRDNAAWEPTAEERVAVYHRLRVLMRECWGEDAVGKERFDMFMPWHLGFFCRYRPLPESLFGGRAIDDPLLQSRLGLAVDGEGNFENLPIVEQLLRCECEEAHAAISEILWRSDTAGDAMDALETVAKASLKAWQAQVAAGDRGSSDDTIRG